MKKIQVDFGNYEQTVSEKLVKKTGTGIEGVLAA